jgi:capsid protein
MLKRLRSWFTRRPEEFVEDFTPSASRNPGLPLPSEVRRWDAASTTDFNAQQWASVTGNTINEDLVTYLPTLIDRCTYEISTNDTISGMVSTHATDICGPGGPNWQIYPRRPIGDSEAERKEFAGYIAEAEDVLSEWFERCDLNGELSGAEILHLGVQQQWATGNAFQQIVNGTPDGANPISIRLHSIHAERILKVPYVTVEQQKYCLGISRSETGRRTGYLVMEPNELGTFGFGKNAKSIPASQMLHHFRTEEPGQIAGVPWLAASLQTIGDIRQFDQATMKAAQLAANLALVFQDLHESTPLVKGSGSSPIKIGLAQIMQAPKGKEVKQIDPKHPASNYTEFRNERWRDVGRSVNMPLMIARLDSKDHSYASARMDRQLYWRSLEREQFAIEKRLTPVLMSVLQEAELRKLIRRRPVAVKVGGLFQVPPHVDPQKEANARATDLSTMSKALIDIWAEQGIRPAEAADKLRRTMDTLDTVRPGLGEAYIQNMLKHADLASVTSAQFLASLTEQAA